MEKKTSLCDPVCFIIKLLRHHVIEIFQFLIFQDLRVQPCHTVDGETGYNRHMRHAHLIVPEDCHFSDLLFIARIFGADLLQETAVDLLDDLVNTRKQLREQIDRPFFQRLCHNRMVGIGTGLCGHFPCLLPGQAFHINEQPHQLRNGNRRMRIIHLDCHLLIKLFDVVVVLFILRNQGLQAG